MIHVLATIEVQPEKREEFLKAFRELIPKVRAEQGCIEYGAAIDLQTPIPSQPALRENIVAVIEKWDDVDALLAHLEAPHMMEYRQAVKDLVVGTEIRVLEPRN